MFGSGSENRKQWKYDKNGLYLKAILGCLLRLLSFPPLFSEKQNGVNTQFGAGCNNNKSARMGY